MCGIISAVSSNRNVVPLLIDGLKRLEYRGYDSAGVAVINGKLERVRSAGRVADLESRIADRHLAGGTGIGHTRWATHGAPSERNAHPHSSGGVSVVHNGIIENHEAIRSRLRDDGYDFASDTDTEVIAHLVNANLQGGSTLIDAVRKTTSELTGAYAIAVISDRSPDRMVVAKKSAPLLLGFGDGENYAASDGMALAAMTRDVAYLEDGDCAEITCKSVNVVAANGDVVQRTRNRLHMGVEATELGAYKHYMQKEIFEQPIALAATLAPVTQNGLSATLFGANAERILRTIDAVQIVACGTSLHSALVARTWLEGIAGIPCSVDIASEFRYRKTVSSPSTLIVAISQSGETADTLAALRYATAREHRASLSICNVAESSLMRTSDLGFVTQAGPEIGVASTKAFTTQLASLAVLAVLIAKLRQRLPREREQEFINDLKYLPSAVCRALELEPAIEVWAQGLAKSEHALFLGRGTHYPIAMEGALKLKEISYIHAEAYAAGELKHGPLALVSSAMPVVALAPNNRQIEKLKSNLQEVAARGGQLFVVADSDSPLEGMPTLNAIRTPSHAGMLSPILHTIPLQLLAYHAALNRNSDVDKPRNLAKSVTVE
jgi:glucosamine--fructose-6-phosphate aminotransferase (isomerizing)